jgi:peptidylprolyl isomerase
MDKTTNVTGTGVAIAIAVVVAVAFVFFGSHIFSFFGTPKNQAVTDSATTTATQQVATTTNQNTMTTTDSNSTVPPATPSANPTSLGIHDITVGTGAEAKVGDNVTVNYVGKLTNGTVFDASANHGGAGFTFPLGAGQVIKGWDQGVVGMKVGGKRELVIPASLGYGPQAVGPIPANSTLVFEVELVSIK